MNGQRQENPPMSKARSPQPRTPARGHRLPPLSPQEAWRKSLAVCFNLISILLTRADLLRRTGLSPRQLARIERGDASPASPALRAALEALDLDPAEFLPLVGGLADTLHRAPSAAARRTRKRSPADRKASQVEHP
jgi:hypothetical protein